MEGKNNGNVTKERLEKENELKRIKEENRQLAKRNNYITASKVWRVRKKLGEFLRPLNRLRKRFLSSKKQSRVDNLEREIYDLHAQKQKLLSELEMKNRLLKVMAFDHDTISHQYMKESIRAISKELKSVDMIYDIVGTYKNVSTTGTAVLDAITNQYNQIQDPEKRDLIFSKLLEAYDIGNIPEKIIRHMEEFDESQCELVASFKTNLALRSTIRNMREETPDHVVDRKSEAYALMDLMNVRRPKTTRSPYTLDEIAFEAGTVIKPTDSAGARGVFIVYSEDTIQRVKDSTIFEGYDELKSKMREELKNGTVQHDLWFTEELISEKKSNKPARDLKFYCFYGKVGLVLEIIRYPYLQYCWWNEEHQIVRTGKYEEKQFHGTGYTEKELETVKEISSKLPIPFMRIDFLKTEEEFAFGEFTPKPGNYDEFDRETDRSLGEMYIDAEYRLFQDLLYNQKSFDEFKKLNRTFGKNESDKES